ncbi:MAG: hypothetical protein DRQ02_02960 [Candidatus Latescibacterota bacterium]|nr:MAG: hypothetical protein DRQ02_02960 [Candidatus Latescibacterota bacterium]
MEKFKIILRRLLPTQKHTKKSLVCLLIGFLALFYAGWIIPKRISISPTPSVGHYIFLYKRHFKPSDIKKHTLVVIPLYTKLIPNCSPCLAVKYVACDSGERLDVIRKDEFYCNGEYLGVAKTHSKTGVPVKIFQYHGIIPEGKFFAMGTCIDSYDSRYIGLEDKNAVKAIALPIF